LASAALSRAVKTSVTLKSGEMMSDVDMMATQHVPTRQDGARCTQYIDMMTLNQRVAAEQVPSE
jgi:hypothetical protein